MLNQNCIVTVRLLTGNESSKSFSTSITGIKATIIPASQETLALYPDLPVGQSFSIIINDKNLTSDLTPESEIEITDVETSQYVVGNKFQLRGQARKDKVLGNTIYSFVAVKVN